MGWDAFATKDGKPLVRDEVMKIANPELREAFAMAFENVKGYGLTPDWRLEYGGLDNSQCADAIEKATNYSCRVDSWTIEQVQEALAKWNGTLLSNSSIPVWAAASAWEFLNVCDDQGLGINFSW